MAKVDISTVVSNIISQNPNVSQDNLRVIVRENLEQMKAKGAKISPKQMAKANALVDEYFARQAQVQFATRTATAPTQNAVQQLNTQKARTIYNNPENVEILTGNAKPEAAAISRKQQVAASATRKGVLRKDAQKAVEYVENVCTGEGQLIPQPQLANKSARASMEVFTGMKAKDFDLLEGMTDPVHTQVGTFSEHLENLEAEGRIAERDAALAQMNQADSTPHESVKTRKAQKKAAEVQSQAEHKAQRPISNKAVSKDVRDANYATRNGIVRHQNRKYLDYVKQTCTGEGNLVPEIRLPKSAKQSFEVFEQAGMITAEKAGKAVAQAVEAANGKEAIVEAGAKNVSKMSKYGKAGLIFAAVAGVAYAATSLFGGDKKDNIEERKTELKLTA